MANKLISTLKILRLKQVIAITGLPRSTLYLRISERCFPRQIKLGGKKAVGWIESDINDWIEDRISESRNESEVSHDPK